MTITQEKRFDNLVERLEKKVEQMFGQTAEDHVDGREAGRPVRRRGSLAVDPDHLVVA